MNGSLPSPPPDFALLGHPDSYDHIGDLFLHSRPDYGIEKIRKYRATLEKFFAWTPTYVSKTFLTVPHGKNDLHGRLIICTFLPESINNPRQLLSACQKTRDGCRLAQEAGARIIGLGGFTSIVGGAQGEDLARDFQVSVTSGNSLTAALALAQLDRLLEKLRWNLQPRTIAVLGASGDIGRACVRVLGPRARQILLIARNRRKLEALKEELPSPTNAFVSTDPRDARSANLIVAATSSPSPLISEGDLAPGTIVCDVGYPKNFSYSSRTRSDVLVFSAGLAEMPFSLEIGYYTRLPSDRLMYGCYSEAMILAMAGRYENFSIGQGRISPEKMETILNLAVEYGFRPASLYRGKTPISDSDLDAFLSHG
jgi:fatty aldehyde-generating acyl-ACP reductase